MATYGLGDCLSTEKRATELLFVCFFVQTLDVSFYRFYCLKNKCYIWKYKANFWCLLKIGVALERAAVCSGALSALRVSSRDKTNVQTTCIVLKMLGDVFNVIHITIIIFIVHGDSVNISLEKCIETFVATNSMYQNVFFSLSVENI
jgi:hypothetical protein